MERRLTKQVFAVAALSLLYFSSRAGAQDPLPSWNDGSAKQTIIEFVQKTTTQSGPDFVLPRSASPPSTRTARYGSSIRFIRR